MAFLGPLLESVNEISRNFFLMVGSNFKSRKSHKKYSLVPGNILNNQSMFVETMEAFRVLFPPLKNVKPEKHNKMNLFSPVWLFSPNHLFFRTTGIIPEMWFFSFHYFLCAGGF